jgi:hypothetical protein
MKTAVEHRFVGDVTTNANYDPNKVTAGPLIQQRTGPGPGDRFIGPMPIGMTRVMESGATAIAGAYPHVYHFDDREDWVFLAENTAGAATRRIMFFTYNSDNGDFSNHGFITLTFPIAGVHTIRGFRVVREEHNEGTVSVSGTTVTGSGTQWQSRGLAAGARIGFGSTDDNDITQWFEISSVDGNGSLTISTTAGTIPTGTPYVIEELRVLVATTNTTVTSGGLFVAKGLNRDLFLPNGTIIPAATTVDNVRAVYWLGDAGATTNTGNQSAGGCAIDTRSSNWSEQMVYVPNATIPARVYAYNIRAPLAGLTAGRSSAALVAETGGVALTGTLSQTNNGRIGVLNHGPGAGDKHLWLVTTTRVYRVLLQNITNGSTSWLADGMIEVPPGSGATLIVNSALISVEIADSIDRLIIMSSGAAGARSYITRYNTSGDQFDHVFLVDDKSQDISTASTEKPVYPSISASIYSIWAEGGVLYLCRNGTANTLNHLYAIPVGADWAYAASTGARAIGPRMSTPGASRLHRLYVNEADIIGSPRLGVSPEPYRAYVRTTGINDNSGTWTPVDSFGDLTSMAPSSEVQFMFEFRTIGVHGIPARLFGYTVVYEAGLDIPSHLRWSMGDTDTSASTIGFVQTNTYGGQFALEIELRRVSNDSLILVQSSDSTTSGIFEFYNGSAWAAGIGPDVVGTRRRFRVTQGIPVGVDMYAMLRVV